MFGWFKSKKPEVSQMEPNKSEFVKDERSSITFYINENFEVVIDSKINKEIVEKLVENGYVREEQVGDEMAIQLAFILLANEVTDQIITEVNEKAEVLTNV